MGAGGSQGVTEETSLSPIVHLQSRIKKTIQVKQSG